MNINELHKHVNNRREKSGLPPKSKEQFLQEISAMQAQGKITVENGEVKPAEEKENK